MEPIDTKAIKDAVCKNNGYRDWNHFLDVLSCGEPIEESQESVFNEVISEVAKQVAERQKQNCKDFIFGNMIYPEYRETVYNGILNAPIPEII